MGVLESTRVLLWFASYFWYLVSQKNCNHLLISKLEQIPFLSKFFKINLLIINFRNCRQESLNWCTFVFFFQWIKILCFCSFSNFYVLIGWWVIEKCHLRLDIEVWFSKKLLLCNGTTWHFFSTLESILKPRLVNKIKYFTIIVNIMRTNIYI